MSAARRSRLVLVVGVGRSGTSLLTGILGQLGLHIPTPEVKADETNPRGFGEPRWVVDFHTRLLRERRVMVNDARPIAWESTAATAGDAAVHGELTQWLEAQLREGDALVVKDPRTVWFSDLWTRSAAEHGIAISFVTMLRHPAEIVASARKSYGPGLTTAGRAAAWINVMLLTEHATRGARRAFVRYEDLLDDWVPEVRRLGSLIGSPPLAAVDKAAHPEVDAFVDPSLHRNRVRWDELDVPGRVREQADEVWEQFQGLAQPGGDNAAAAAALDQARAAYRALYAEAEAIAQSSVIAGRIGARARARAAPPPPASLRVRLARRVPARYRKRLRAAIGSLRARS
jgi:hypothetical protein